MLEKDNLVPLDLLETEDTTLARINRALEALRADLDDDASLNTRLECSHTFHAACLSRWASQPARAAWNPWPLPPGDAYSRQQEALASAHLIAHDAWVP